MILLYLIETRIRQSSIMADISIYGLTFFQENISLKICALDMEFSKKWIQVMLC